LCAVVVIPTARIRWKAILWPPADGYGECLLNRILGNVNVAEDAD
jgi:hypothetical protein